MKDYCEFCQETVGPGLGKIPGQCPLLGHGTHHDGCCQPVAWRADPTVAEVAVRRGYEASLAPIGGQGDRTDWWVYAVGGERLVAEGTGATYPEAKRQAEAALRRAGAGGRRACD